MILPLFCTAEIQTDDNWQGHNCYGHSNAKNMVRTWGRRWVVSIERKVGGRQQEYHHVPHTSIVLKREENKPEATKQCLVFLNLSINCAGCKSLTLEWSCYQFTLTKISQDAWGRQYDISLEVASVTLIIRSERHTLFPPPWRKQACTC